MNVVFHAGKTNARVVLIVGACERDDRIGGRCSSHLFWLSYTTERCSVGGWNWNFSYALHRMRLVFTESAPYQVFILRGFDQKTYQAHLGKMLELSSGMTGFGEQVDRVD